MKKDKNGQGILSKEVTKMQERLRKVGPGLAAVGLCMTLILGAAVPVCEAGPVEKVRIGSRLIITGAIASTAAPHAFGVIDYLRWINEQGGINGIMVENRWEDTAAMVPREVMAHKRNKTAGVVLELGISSSGAEATTPLQQRDQIPLLYATGITPGMFTTPERWVIGSGTATGDTMASDTVKWFNGNWKQERPMRVGNFIYDFTSGWIFRDATEYICPRVGAEYVGYEVVPLLCVDTSVELLRLAAKKPDLVIVFCTGVTLTTLVKDIARLGIQEKGIKLAGQAAVPDRSTIRITGKDAEGWYMTAYFPLPGDEAEFPGLLICEEATARYRGWEPEEIPFYYLAGWFQSLIGVEGVRQAIEMVGVEKLTGKDVRKALVSFKNLETGWGPPITTSEEEQVIAKSRVYQIRNGMFVAVSGFLEPTITYKYFLEK